MVCVGEGGLCRHVKADSFLRQHVFIEAMAYYSTWLMSHPDSPHLLMVHTCCSPALLSPLTALVFHTGLLRVWLRSST